MLKQEFLFEQLLATIASVSPRKTRVYKADVLTKTRCSLDGKCNIAIDIATRRVRGESFGMIANALNRQGMTSINGSRWYPASVRAYYRKICSKS